LIDKEHQKQKTVREGVYKVGKKGGGEGDSEAREVEQKERGFERDRNIPVTMRSLNQLPKQQSAQ